MNFCLVVSIPRMTAINEFRVLGYLSGGGDDRPVSIGKSIVCAGLVCSADGTYPCLPDPSFFDGGLNVGDASIVNFGDEPRQGNAGVALQLNGVPVGKVDPVLPLVEIIVS